MYVSNRRIVCLGLEIGKLTNSGKQEPQVIGQMRSYGDTASDGSSAQAQAQLRCDLSEIHLGLEAADVHSVRLVRY